MEAADLERELIRLSRKARFIRRTGEVEERLVAELIRLLTTKTVSAQDAERIGGLVQTAEERFEDVIFGDPVDLAAKDEPLVDLLEDLGRLPARPEE